MRLPALRKAEDTYHSLSQGGRAVFLFFAALCVVSSVSLLYILNASALVTTAAYGGEVREGVIGSPRFINPILAISDSDRDLTSLIYSGLLKATPEGNYIPDLAEKYTISNDGKVYTFTLREKAAFHDGTPVTADDVVFTISKAQDAALKSPVRANWDGVTVVAIDAHTIEFDLKNPYAPFIENMTLGILPKHLWQGVSDDEFSFSDLNVEPVGSGPYRIDSISRSAAGIPSTYTLSAFSRYTQGKPYLSSMVFHFYQNEQALLSGLRSGDVDAASGISPAALANLSEFDIERAPLNRIFAVFFNQNQSIVLRDHDVRAALNTALDRNALVTSVLGGYGTALTGPTPPAVVQNNTNTIHTSGDPAAEARSMLLSKGWVVGNDGVLTKTTGKGKSAVTQTLTFSLATANVPELRAAAEELRNTWEKMGAKVDVQIYEQGDLTQNVIRPRKYDALLFGEVIGREVDLFAFWHSSQRNDPGLNIALYANATADKALEQLRATSDEGQRAILYTQFQNELAKDIPAIFLYAPDFVYIVPKDISGLNLGFIESPSDRFLSITDWHSEVDHVWPLFANTQK